MSDNESFSVGVLEWVGESKEREQGTLGQNPDILALYVDFSEEGFASTLSSTKSKLQLDESRRGVGVSSIHVTTVKDGSPTLRLTLTTYSPQAVLERLKTCRDSLVDYTVRQTACNYYVKFAI